jgi:hypothetical protein
LRWHSPAVAYQARPKAGPATDIAPPDPRIRCDRIDTAGAVSLRYDGRLHHIGVGRAHTGTDVLLLAVDRDVRIINADTGELLRELVLDPTRDYNQTGVPPTFRTADPIRSAPERI